MVISKNVTPTVFYWLNEVITKVVHPQRLNKKRIKDFNTIILVRYIPFNIFFVSYLFKKEIKKNNTTS